MGMPVPVPDMDLCELAKAMKVGVSCPLKAGTNIDIKDLKFSWPAVPKAFLDKPIKVKVEVVDGRTVLGKATITYSIGKGKGRSQVYNVAQEMWEVDQPEYLLAAGSVG